MPRTGENIYKRKDGRWEGRYIKAYAIDGKAKYGFLHSRSYAEIKTKLNIAKAKSITQTPAPSANHLFSEIAEKWLQNIKLNFRFKSTRQLPNRTSL